MSIKFLARLALAIVIALSVTACKSSGNSQPAPQQSTAKKIGDPEEGGFFSSVFKRKQPAAIVLPPDLVSSANDTVQENHNKAQQERSAVLPDIIGAEIRQDGQTRWLRVESDAQKAWDKLTQFWADEQIDLVEFKPAAGLMETDWIETGARSEQDKNRIVAKFFNRITGKDTAFDKFKVRLERESEEVTNIYVTHRSTERKESNFNSPAKVTEWEWVEKDSDPEKVAQLLQVMVLVFESGEPGSV